MIKNFSRLAISLLFALLGTLFAQANEITSQLERYIDEQNIDGASFFASIDGKVIEVVAGTIDPAQKEETAVGTRFYIASTGKMMVAAAILSMVEDGNLQLDEPIWPLIESIGDIERLKNADVVTLRQILNHTSGLAEYLNEEFDDASQREPAKRWTPEEALSFAYDAEPVFSPGKSFEYTNTNYVLLGYILGQIDGTIEKALENRIFNKAGMNTASVGAQASAPHLAHGFDEDGNDASEQAWASILGDGPVVSTAQDVAKFMQALFDSRKLLGQNLLDQMLTGSQHDEGYGLGMGVDEDEWGHWYGHAGSYGGFEADVRLYPDLNSVMVVLMNGNPDEENPFLDTAAQKLF